MICLTVTVSLTNAIKYLGEHTEGSWGRFEGEFRKGKSHGKMTVYYK